MALGTHIGLRFARVGNYGPVMGQVSEVCCGLLGPSLLAPGRDTYPRRSLSLQHFPTVERRGRDSNPRSGETGRQFSRLVHSTALPPLRGGA